jgi:hypothetical protein
VGLRKCWKPASHFYRCLLWTNCRLRRLSDGLRALSLTRVTVWVRKKSPKMWPIFLLLTLIFKLYCVKSSPKNRNTWSNFRKTAKSKQPPKGRKFGLSSHLCFKTSSLSSRMFTYVGTYIST